MSARLLGALAGALCCAAPALAQETDPAVAPAPVASLPVTSEGPRTYTPEDFARYAPRTAIDMLSRVPGFTIRGPGQGRGLGEASANVLLNGQRISGKSDDVSAQLGRIPAQNVARIEIVDGATLDVPGLSGQVANVVTRTSPLSGQYSWRPEFRLRHTDPLFTRFDASVSGALGPIEFTLGVENGASRSGAGGRTEIYHRDLTLRELRDDRWKENGEVPRVSGRFVYDGPGSSVGNLNLSYRRFYYDFEEVGRRTLSDTLPDRTRIVTQEVRAYDYEIGGDFELALTGGRLKLIGLDRREYNPTVQIAIVTPDGGTPAGDRYATIRDTRERIARAEYRWCSGGADWQVSAEAAFNSLDSQARLFSLTDDGDFAEVPFPGGTARVEEDRYETIASYGRPLAANLALQASIGGEYSTLRQIGANGLTRSFWRPKGQVSLAWSPSERLDLNLRLQRRVGQLNFLDFLQSVNLTNGNENAGNPDLVPPQSWEADVEAVRDLGAYGSTTLRLYGRWYDDIVDIVPVGATGESPGNIDHALLYGAEWKGTLNFDPMGWRGARLDARLQFQRSRVEDPLTGEPREISGALQRHMSLSLRHDVAGTEWAWGGGLAHDFAALATRLTQIGRQWEGPVWGNLFVEHKNVMGLTVRATANNLLGARSTWNRIVYEGRRTGPIAYYESRNRSIGPILSFSISGRF